MAEEGTLKEKTAKGLMWGGLSNSIQQLLNLIFGIFLARLLNASDYGMVGMLSIFTLVANALQESGLTAALTNKKNITHNDYNAVFWFSSLMGLSLYIILFFLSPYIAAFFEDNELTYLARYQFICFFISSLGTAQNAYLFKNLMVKQKSITLMIALLVSGIVGVTLAFNGYAYWGIVTQNIVYTSTVTLCYWYFSPWRPTFNIDLSPIKGMIRFASKLLITNIFYHINNNIFSIILGKFYSANEVGYYNQANKWNYMGHSLINSMITGVAQPVFANTMNEKERQQRIFLRLIRFTAFLSFPAMLGLSLIAKDLIVIAITDKWLPSASILQILCLGSPFIPIISIYTNLLISKGHSNIYMWNNIALCLTQLTAMLLLYPYKIHCMVSVYVAINIAWLAIWHYYIKKEIDISLSSVIRTLLPYLAAASIVMLVTHFAVSSITNNVYWAIISKIIMAALLYTFIMWIMKSEELNECIAFVRQKIRKK